MHVLEDTAMACPSATVEQQQARRPAAMIRGGPSRPQPARHAPAIVPA